jgi:hypothetical protein
MSRKHLQNVLDDAEQLEPVVLRTLDGRDLTVTYHEVAATRPSKTAACCFFSVTCGDKLISATTDDEATMATLIKEGVSFRRGS